MTTSNASLCLLLLLSVSGCASTPTPPPTTPVTAPETQYHARVVAPDTGEALDVSTLADRLRGMDVVVVGEYHGHHGAHLLQSRLQAALYQRNRQQVLTMEQFEVNHQPALDRYLAGEIGEAELIEDAEAWDNYRASYRPLVEFARTRDLPVLAANAPSDLVRCVGREGPGFLAQLPEQRRQHLPEAPFTDTPAYQDKFLEAIAGRHGGADATLTERLRNTYQAQLLRDNTMASRILAAHDRYPGHQVLHLTGTFHSEDRLGTVALLAERAPELEIAVISPVFWPSDQPQPALDDLRGKGDYLYFIQPLPDEFRDAERARAAMTERFSRSSAVNCD